MIDRDLDLLRIKDAGCLEGPFERGIERRVAAVAEISAIAGDLAVRIVGVLSAEPDDVARGRDQIGAEGDVIITQDLFLYDIVGEDAQGKLIGRHKSTGIGRPRFWDRARYFGEEKRLAAALDAAEQAGKVNP